MIITLINESALEYWLNGTGKESFPSSKPVDLSRDFDFKMNEEFASDLAKQYNLSEPVHFMVPDSLPRRKHEKYHLCARSPRLPKQSFIELEDREGEAMFVACPEMCFIYAARILPLKEVVRVGCMLCAKYVLDENEILKMRNRSPITSVAKIKRYLKKSSHLHGIKKARRALQYVLDNCNSPMEVNLAVAGCLSRMYGGFSVYQAIMNGEVKLNEAGALLVRSTSIHVDMLWPQLKCALEYDSNLTHLTKYQHATDKKRSTALSMSGYTLLSITASQVGDLFAVEKTFFMIRKALKMKSRPKRFAKYEFLRHELIKDLFLKSWKPIFNKKKIASAISKT